ncbi:MAG: ATP-dependent DNA helicase, partial [Lachnospiraceae bacterium]|nr:ATP-dependent DNA helicase [Lachnospiraceae bacterium]
NLLREKGNRFKMLEITARDKICPLEERVCDASHCEYAKGHYDRINDVIYKIINEEDLFNRDIILSYAQEGMVCPYRLSLEIARFSDEIVCDYNYVFDPNAAIVKSISDKNNIFLVDEAHNLVDRARNMYSVSIIKEDVLAMKKVFGAYDKSLIKYFDRLNREMLAFKKMCDEPMVIIDRNKLDTLIINLRYKIEMFFDKKIKMADRKRALEFYFNLCNYVNTLDFVDETYITYADFNDAGCFVIHLCNLDPSVRLQLCLDNAVSTSFFSATLLPVNYYKEVLCKKENPTAIYAKTIFDSSQRVILIANDVTSKYNMRSSAMYEKIAEYIIKTVNVKKGNYIAYFPSYAFMDNVYNALLDLEFNQDIIIQNMSMNEQEREAFIEEFEVVREKSLVALCVLGGIFAEGIDLVGGKLIGTIIVGTGLPQTNFESELLKDYYKYIGRDGYGYAYRYPGMNKVCQAAGRVIRTVDDRGVILLLDFRFNYSKYKSIFPREWKDAKNTNIETVESQLKEFWDANLLPE